jgi:hypothetical protein
MKGMDNMDSVKIIETLKWVVFADEALAKKAFYDELQKSGITVPIENIKSMIFQWRYNSEYIPYFPEDTELLIEEDRMFLIPKEEKLTKPIKLIMA